MSTKLSLDKVRIKEEKVLSRGETCMSDELTLTLQFGDFYVEFRYDDSLIDTLGYKVWIGDMPLKSGNLSIGYQEENLTRVENFQKAIEYSVAETPLEGCLPSPEDSEYLDHYADVCINFVVARSMAEKRQR